MSINRVVLVGRLTRDPEMKYSQGGKAVAKFTVAVDRIVGKGGEKEADFIPCACFDKQAEFAGSYLNKGRLVAVEGRIQIRNYETKEGEKRTFTEVVCDRVQGLDKAKEQPDAVPGSRENDPFAGQE